MEHSKNESNRRSREQKGIVYSFFVVSAALGLLIGLFEAFHLWTTPRFIPLLVPDVGYVVWFLAPLIDMLLFALVGLALGGVAIRTRGKEASVAFEIAFAATFIFAIVRWFHSRYPLEPFLIVQDFLFPLLFYAAAFTVSTVFLELNWRWLAASWERRRRALLKPLERGLVVAVIIAVVGIGVFHFQPSLSSTTVRAAPPPSGVPNIVFITLDTVRADHLSSYGYDRPTTPNLDRFARTGVLFENAIAPTSWTLASHASMFTGLLPQQHGADSAVPLPSGPRTMANVLRSQGYDTAGFAANLLYMQKGWGIARGFDTYADNSVSLRHNLGEMAFGIGAIQPLYQHFYRFDYFGRQSAYQINQRVFRWFRRRPQSPFFVFINYFDAHEPYLVPGPFNHRFGKMSMASAHKLLAFSASSRKFLVLSRQSRNSIIDGYDNSLAYLDDQVGNLLKFFHQTPEWRNTIFIITSDHGDEFGGHGSYDHGRNLYRAVLHVPLIIAGPGIPKGVRVSHIVATRELFSTILNFVYGGKKPFDRCSLARFWNSSYKPTSFDDAIVSELVPVNDLSAQRAMMSLTTPQWEYIEHRNGRQELYRWTVDPHEQDNLAASPQDQATLKKLRLRLIGLVSNAVGPWRGKPYLQALDKVAGSSRLNLLFPKPFQPGAVGNADRIGIVQAYFDTRQSASTRPSRSERDLLKSLPYQ